MGRKAIEEYAYSDPEVLPILSNLTSGGESQEAEQQIESASSQLSSTFHAYFVAPEFCC